MSPTESTSETTPFDPQLNQLRQQGWAVTQTSHRCCVAWRGHEEIVLVRHGNDWHRTAPRAAA